NTFHIDRQYRLSCQFKLFTSPCVGIPMRPESLVWRQAMRCRIVGAPVQDGAGRMGCEMGPSALRTAGLVAMLKELGHEVEDFGQVQRGDVRPLVHGNAALKALPEINAWTVAIAQAAYE